MNRPPEPETTVDYYGPLAWASRYMIDWGYCGPVVKPIRMYTTIIRWFADPIEREHQLENARRWTDPPYDELPQQLHINLKDLLDADVSLPLTLSRHALGMFFRSLDDGDLIEGGPTPDWIPKESQRIRPGAAYLYGKWFRWFANSSPPWDFTMFPRKEIFVIA